MTSTAAFARDAGTAAYYNQRAAEYDQWYLGAGRFAAIDRPGWPEAVAEIQDLVRRLAPARTLDIACGTGFLTQHLPGLVIGLDQSEAMVALAQSPVAGAHRNGCRHVRPGIHQCALIPDPARIRDQSAL